MKRSTRWLVGVPVGLVVATGAIAAVFFRPQVHDRGRVTKASFPAQVQAARAADVASQIPGPKGPEAAEVLFGDLHVHTTFSTDAFAWSLPLVRGEGAHPPAEACDFARFCSDLDFFALTDHAESLTPRRWAETKASIRECNAAAGDPANPDLVAYAGFEWTQVGLTRETHYGHRNVVFRDDAEDKLPTRPIAAAGKFAGLLRGPSLDPKQVAVLFRDLKHRQHYLDWTLFQRETAGVERCATGVDVRQLPLDCMEAAETPQELFEKLAQWDYPVLAIPHGTTWGMYTPPGVNWKKQLTRQMTDPERQTLIEVYSGHGNAEEYRDYQEVTFDAAGNPVCPASTDQYEPCCQRAGGIIKSRCGDASDEECERRVQQAQQVYLRAGASGHHTVPGATVEDWKDCGQCRDCFQPTFSHRAGNSVQAILATTDFSDPNAPVSHQFGFVGSSDNHKARPGTGYKAYARREMTEATGPCDEEARETMFVGPGAAKPVDAQPIDPLETVFANGFSRMEFERSSSYFTTGGLVAVHSSGRSREAIWDAMTQRRVYATSGDRILLWFSLLNGSESFMGTRTDLGETPRLRVRAVGAFEQQPGCPDWARTALGDAGIERMCRGECYNPGDRRRSITRIEVVRIRPQRTPDEAIGPLIEDPWKTIECPPNVSDCNVDIEDPTFVEGGRDALYYVRAIQEPTPEVNGATLRCDKDASGRCIASHPCYSDYRTAFDDACLAPVEERAWSSPIYIDYVPPPAVIPSDAGTRP